MVQAVPREGVIEQYEKPMPQKHWQRNKKQAVIYAHDTPFVTEKQLEDQRQLMNLNRNPRALEFTKGDKIRSEVLNAKKGEARPVAVKAHVVNKIVREASGVYNYAIVPPPRQKDTSIVDKDQKVDPELHPRLKPYASEAKMKPIICSFGHRPSSASRTFHPATMKFRLKHSEVAKSGSETQTGFGLPVAVLAKVLKAPPIRPPSAQQDIFVDDTISEPTLDSGHHNHGRLEYSDLFLSAEDERNLFDPIRKQSKTSESRDEAGNNGETNWLSSTERSKLQRTRNSNSKKLEPLSTTIDRPPWDEAHAMIYMTNKERYSLKESRMLKGEVLPVVERLKRFNPVSAGLMDFDSGFCDSKRFYDKKAMAGVILTAPKSTPIKGRPLYFDPYDIQLKEVKMRFKELKMEKEAKLEAMKYQDALYRIPEANYFPTTELAKIGATEGGSGDGEGEGEEAEDIDWTLLERGYRAAMKAARKGDTKALHNFNMKMAADIVASVPIADSNGRPPSPIGRSGSPNSGRISSRKSTPNKD